jgi:hypothetical protein
LWWPGQAKQIIADEGQFGICVVSPWQNLFKFNVGPGPGEKLNFTLRKQRVDPSQLHKGRSEK